MVLDHGACRSVRDEPGVRPCGDHAAVQDNPTPRVVEDDVRPVVGARSSAQAAEIGGDRVGQAEQLQGLIGQVRAEVEPQSPTGAGVFPPAVARAGAEPVDVGFEMGDLTDESAVDDPLDAQIVAIPAAVLEHRHDPLTTIGGVDDRTGILQRQCERCVDHDVMPGRQRRLGERPVGVIGRRDHHHVHIAAGDESVGIDDMDTGMVGVDVGGT